VDGDLPTASPDTPAYANLGMQGALWVPIVEKAWAFYRNAKGTYASISGEWNPSLTPMGIALGAPEVDFFAVNFPNSALYLKAIQNALASGKAVKLIGPASLNPNTVMCAIDNPATDQNENVYRSTQHSFTVTQVITDANGNPVSVVLRNPYGGYVTIGADLLFYCSYGYETFDVS
jgi:hypothetical protein